MKKQIFAFLAGICLTAGIAGVLLERSSRQVRSRETTVTTLTQQVDYLSQTVADLRKELTALREHQRAAAASVPVKTLPPVRTDWVGPEPGRVVPDGKTPAGQPFEFNGRTYYLTPLENRAGGPNVVAK
jgi:hypothetical protein